MRRFAGFLAVFLFAILGGSLANAYALKSFEGRFSVEFPSTPKLEHIRDVGTCRTDRYEYKVAERGRVWFASYQDCLPRGFLADVGHGPFMRDFYKGVVKSVRGDLRANDPIEHGVMAGREILVAIPHGNQVLRMQIFIDGDRLYKVMYVGPFQTQANPEVEAFFASFRVMR